MNLIEDVDLGATRRTERNLGDEVTDVIDLVVGGGVELVEVEGAALFDGEAALALTTRLAVGQVLAVERLGQDTGRTGLAGASWAAEEVGMGMSTLGHCGPQRLGDMLLTADLLEVLGPVSPVEGLVRHGPSLASPWSRASGCRRGTANACSRK